MYSLAIHIHMPRRTLAVINSYLAFVTRSNAALAAVQFDNTSLPSLDNRRLLELSVFFLQGQLLRKVCRFDHSIKNKGFNISIHISVFFIGLELLTQFQSFGSGANSAGNLIVVAKHQF